MPRTVVISIITSERESGPLWLSLIHIYIAAVANRGTVFELSLLDKLTDSDGNLITDYTPVSYTHLDVYKRKAVYILKRDTRHFAKRQLTWFRREKDVRWLYLDQYQRNADLILADILKDCEQAEIVLK